MPRHNTQPRDAELHQTGHGLIGRPTGTLLSQYQIMRQSARAHNNAVRLRLARSGRYSPRSVTEFDYLLDLEYRSDTPRP